MDVQPKAPKPLTEAQRNEVRNLLRQLSASSASRRSKVGNKNPLSRKKARKVKRIENVFEGIEEGKTVNGFTEVGPDCCTLTFVQRVQSSQTKGLQSAPSEAKHLSPSPSLSLSPLSHSLT